MGLFKKKIPPAAKMIMDYLDCPCEFISGGKSQAEIMIRYADAAEQGKTEGFTPIIIVVSEVHAEIFEDCGSREEFYNSVMSAEKIDPEKWFDERMMQDEEFYSEENFEDVEENVLNSGDLAKNSFSAIMNFSNKRTLDLILAKIPTVHPWEVFAWLPFGGWNECPENSEIMQIAEYWHKKYGAVPAVMSGDELEFTAHPVSSDDAKELAREQFIFCSDIIFQGVGHIDVLKKILETSSVWYFWWD